MKILAFAASNSRNSINRALVEHAASRLRAEILPEAQIEFLDLNDFEMPIFSIDRERAGGIPAPAREFFDRIGAADALLASFAEHNGYVSAAWKNIFDWMSRIETKIWQGKPIVILSASPGRRAGSNVLASQNLQIPRFGGHVRGKLGIGGWSEAWDAKSRTLTRSQDAAALDAALAGFTLHLKPPEKPDP
ncbi:MAG: NAD(P)H-dependent oxidoreductase [Albidovulum sp.]|nr:NAD(P)H-dependent oxidoreductase [Albidovulum sp.]